MRAFCYVLLVAALFLCINIPGSKSPAGRDHVSTPTTIQDSSPNTLLLAQDQNERLCCQCCLDCGMSRCSYMDFDKCQAKGGFCVTGPAPCAMSVD